LTKPNWVSAVTQYKEVSIRVLLGKGTYIIVPSTSKPGIEGRYYLSIYSACPKVDIYELV